MKKGEFWNFDLVMLLSKFQNSPFSFQNILNFFILSYQSLNSSRCLILKYILSILCSITDFMKRTIMVSIEELKSVNLLSFVQVYHICGHLVVAYVRYVHISMLGMWSYECNWCPAVRNANSQAHKQIYFHKSFESTIIC